MYPPIQTTTHLSENRGKGGGAWMSTSCLISGESFWHSDSWNSWHTYFYACEEKAIEKNSLQLNNDFPPSTCITYTVGVGRSSGRRKKLQTSLFVEQGRVKCLFCCYWQSWYIYERLAVLPTILEKFRLYNKEKNPKMSSSGEFLNFHFIFTKYFLYFSKFFSLSP